MRRFFDSIFVASDSADLELALYASDHSRFRFARLGRWYEKTYVRLGYTPAYCLLGVMDYKGVLSLIWRDQSKQDPWVWRAADMAWTDLNEDAMEADPEVVADRLSRLPFPDKPPPTIRAYASEVSEAEMRRRIVNRFQNSDSEV